jgi:hypothetical protein
MRIENRRSRWCSPADGTTDVPLHPRLDVTFNEPVRLLPGERSSLQLFQGARPVPITTGVRHSLVQWCCWTPGLLTRFAWRASRSCGQSTATVHDVIQNYGIHDSSYNLVIPRAIHRAGERSD